MKYYKRCVQPDTRPKIVFDDEGICQACRYTERIKNIDWKKRSEELKNIAQHAKDNNHDGYDCAIGVSGGKDSLLQAIYARDKLGLNCLLVNAVPECITEIGKYDIDNLSKIGFDMINLRPNPNIMKQLIKRDFYKYGNPQKVTEYTLWTSVFHIALAFKIPLVIQGESQALTLGVKTEGHDSDATTITSGNTISGGDAYYEYSEIDKKHLIQYQFTDKKKMKEANIKAIYLQYYLKDWSWRNNAKFALKHGLHTRKESLYDIGRYTRFGQLDSDMNIYNQMLKYIKFGFGFATDEANYDIRDGLITRNEGIALVKEFDGLCHESYIKDFCDYIDITVDEFWKVANSFRGDMWKKVGGEWKLKNPIWEQESVDDIDIEKVLERIDGDYTR